MKEFLKRFWPWKEINELRQRISFLTSELDRERNHHNKTKSENIAIKGELKIHQVKAVEREGHVRKMAQIIAIKGGILAVLFSCLSISAQPFIRNPVTTNTLGNAPTTAYFLGWDGILTKPAWVIPPAGISVAVNTNAVAVTNGQLVTISGVTDTNAVNGLLGSVTNGAINNLSNYVFTLSQNATNQSLKIGGNDTNNDILMATGITNGAINNLSNYVNTISVNATNQGTVVSNGVVAHTVTVAGTANQIASSVGTAQALASNPSTTLSLPNPTLFPGTVRVSGLTNTANTLLQGTETNSTLTSGFIVADSLGGRTARTINAGDVNFTWTNAIDSTNVTITGPTQIYGDKFRTNGSYISNGGEVFSNNLGQVIIRGGNVSSSAGFTGSGHTLTNVPFFFTVQSYMILSSAVSANQTNFFAVNGTTTKSTSETSTKQLYIGNGNGAWVSNFWVYFNSSIGTSTNLMFYLITNGVATTMGFNFVGNSSANRYVSDTLHPFFLPEFSDWSIGLTNNNNLPSSLVFSWGITVYPQ